MSHHDIRSAERPAPDRVLVDIAPYARDARITSDVAYETARYCLMDTLACGFQALAFPACTRMLGPVVPGATMAGGARVPGTSYELDPVQAAFNIGAMIRWLDFNDTWLAAEWGHPSDNLGGILAVADWQARKATAEGRAPPTVRDLLTAMIKAHEIQGVTALENAYNRVGLDHVILVRVATTAVVTAMLGGTEDQVVNAVSNAWIDGGALRTYRHAPNTGSRKSWAAGDATSRGVRHALIALRGEMGYPSALTAPKWGFYDVLFRGNPFVYKQGFGSYVMENVLFKISFPAEFHAQTAVECAMRLHPEVKGPPRRDRAHRDRDAGAGRAHHRQDRPARESRRPRPLHPVHGRGSADPRPADGRGLRGRRRRRSARGCAALAHGGAREPAIHPDYYDADKRFIGNAIQVFFQDGSRTERIHVDAPIGHRRRRAEGYPVLVEKFRGSLPSVFPEKQCRRIEALFADPARLDATPVDDFVAHLVRN